MYDYIYSVTKIPITYDNLHFRCNKGDLSSNEALKLAISTWGKYRPLFHFSDNDINNKNPRAHTDYVRELPVEYKNNINDIDFEFEFKSKDYAIEKFETQHKL